MAIRNIATYSKILEASVEKLKGKILVIDSYDGAIHSNTKNGRASIVSFSSLMLSSQILKNLRSLPVTAPVY